MVPEAGVEPATFPYGRNVIPFHHAGKLNVGAALGTRAPLTCLQNRSIATYACTALETFTCTIALDSGKSSITFIFTLVRRELHIAVTADKT